MSVRKIEKFIMVWIHETEKWHYFKETFDASVFKDGYTDYKIRVEDGIIVDDEWLEEYEGKQFVSCYDVKLWEPTLV